MSTTPDHGNGKLNRRHFLKTTAAGVGAAAVAGAASRAAEEKSASGQPAARVDEKDLIWHNKHSDMDYARLGRTNVMISRIVAGWIKDLPLERLFARGVNYYDCALGYADYEVTMGEFLKGHRDKLFLVSKATNVAGYQRVDAEVIKLFRAAMKGFIGESEGEPFALHLKAVEKQKLTGEKPDLRPAGKRMAELYLEKIDQSLSRMKTDHVDAYFVHGVAIPWMFDCIEVWEAYEKAHKAGKVKHFGFSTHDHQKEVLAAAAEANARGPWKIDLCMPGVNPVTFDDWRGELAALKKQDVGIIAMKTMGIKGKPIKGAQKERLERLGDISTYNDWERKKLYMLQLTEGLIDGAIAAVKSVEEMDRTLKLASVKLTAEAARELRALVKLQMAGTCHLCGNCETVCPEHIVLTDMIRYHAYVYQYDEKELARELYAEAGYDPSKRCTSCGKCTDVCPSDVRITQILSELPAAVA